MPEVCVIRWHYFRDRRLQVNARLDSRHSIPVMCLGDTGEPLREQRGRLTISRMPMGLAAGACSATTATALVDLLLEEHRHAH